MKALQTPPTEPFFIPFISLTTIRIARGLFLIFSDGFIHVSSNKNIHLHT